MADVANRIDRPVEGLYQTRLAKGMGWVAARIYRSVAVDQETGEPLDRSPVLLGEIFDPATGPRYVDPYELWTRVMGRAIPESEYRYLIACAEWEAEHGRPMAPAPTLRELPPIAPPKGT